jgi:diguanylate cyclase (GGDEF)-like protein/PAS domain S-box-containing protein
MSSKHVEGGLHQGHEAQNVEAGRAAWRGSSTTPLRPIRLYARMRLGFPFTARRERAARSRALKGGPFGAGAVMPVAPAGEQFALHAQLLDEVDAAVVLLDFSGEHAIVRYWSEGARRLYGYSAEEAMGQALMDLVVPEESNEVAMRLRATVLAGVAIEDELAACDKHGRVFPVYARMRPVPPGDGIGPKMYVAVAVDISARREAEAALVRHVEAQREVVNLGRLALSGGCLDEVFEQAVAAAARVLSSDCAQLFERVPGTQDLVVAASVGWPQDRKGDRVAASEPSSLQKVAGAGGLALVEDWKLERRFPPSQRLVDRGVRSSVAVLIGEPEAPLGVLAVHYQHAGAVPSDCPPFLDGLANVLAESMRTRDVQEAIRHRALHDELTGLPNRTLFLDRVAHALVPSERDFKPPAVLVVDLDHFKLVNDSLGHETGDELLRLVTPRLANAIRRQDTLARLGGDEFAVLCEQLPSEAAVTAIAGHLNSALQEPIMLGGDEHTVSASIGIAVGTPGAGAAELLRDADAAMYQAKIAGRGRFELFDREMHIRVLDRVRTESALRAALANEEIHLHYQPLVSLRGGEIVGAEALARWRHVDWGSMSPAEFVAVAEDSGLIRQLGAQVMRRAARESAAWQHVPGFAHIAVNVSTRQLLAPDEVSTLIREVTAAEGIPPGFLTVEITESMLIERLDAARSALEALNDLGVRLSLDDFGTGYSSLSYLANLNFDDVKIDRLLIEKIVTSQKAAALAAAIIHMGHALGQQVIAEGVETIEQAIRLQELDCDIAQGYYFARPMEPEAFTTLLEQRGGPNWPALPTKPTPAVQPRRRPTHASDAAPASRRARSRPATKAG